MVDLLTLVDPLMTAYEKAVQTGTPEELAAAIRTLLAPSTVLSEPLLRQMLEQSVTSHDHMMVLEIGHRLLLTQPHNISILINLGQSAMELRKFDLARMYLQQGLQQATSQNDQSGFHSTLARLLKDHALMDQALFHFQQAYLKNPTSDAASNLIMCLQYSAGATLKDFYAQAAEYSQLFAAPRRQHSFERLDAAKAKTGLRIGFVSGDFVAHSLCSLLVDIFRNFTAVGPHQTYLYHTRTDRREDEMTKRYQEYATQFRFVGELGHDELADLIIEDQIDVLVDLSGHTSASRMPVFLRKPAPVQLGWVCGMMTPCGLQTVPYFLADAQMVTPEIRALCPEQLIELPCAYSYNPLVELPVNQQLPSERLGQLTFGCMNNPCKLNRQVIETWAAIMTKVPNSQFRLKVNSVDSALHLRRTFEELGISNTRLGWLTPTKSNHEIMKFYSESIDIALDPWPCAGMLTTLEAWWMGCPTITLAGPTFLHRQSVSVNTHLELPELIANTTDEYIAKAVALATNRPRLKELRRTSRRRLDATIIRRPEELARGVLAGIEQAWTHWCTSRQTLRALPTAAAA